MLFISDRPLRIKVNKLPLLLGLGDGPHNTNAPTATASPTPANTAILSTSIITIHGRIRNFYELLYLNLI